MDCIPGAAQEIGLHAAGAAPVAVLEGMHSRDVIVQSQSLEQRLALQEIAGGGFGKPLERPDDFPAPLGPAMGWAAEGHVLVLLAEGARLAMVVVAAGHHQPVDFQDGALHRQVQRRGFDPSIGLFRGGRLALAARPGLLWRFIAEGRFKLIAGEGRAFDAGGALHLMFQLHLAQRFHPIFLVGQPAQGFHA